MERFHPDGTSRSRPAPAFEPLYRRSHLVRFVVHRILGYDSKFMRAWGEPQRVAWAAQLSLLEVIDRYRALAGEHGFGFRVLVHPTSRDIECHQLPFFKPFFGLLRDRAVDHWDLTPGFTAALGHLELEDYAWPIDRHFKQRGYAVFAEEAEKALLGSGLLTDLVSTR